MRRLDKRLLPASVLMAAIVSASAFSLAQSPATQSSTSTPKSNTQPTTTASLPKPDTTAEQLAEALTAHQRYQAAMEPYKKAPPSDADAWNKMGMASQLMFNL